MARHRRPGNRVGRSKGSTSRPATAGRGDRAQRGGRGAGVGEFSSNENKRRVTRPLHHTTRGPPPPLSRWRISAIILAARLRPRVLQNLSREARSRGWKRMRGVVPRCFSVRYARFANSKQRKKKEAERRQALTLSAAPSDAARVLRDALACRRSTTALTRGTYYPKAQLGPGFLRLGRSARSCKPTPTGAWRFCAV